MISAVWGNVEQPVNQAYGYTDLTIEPLYNGRHFHCGIDVGDPNCKGKPLYAARAGVVTWYSLGLLGITVANGETDWYAHGEYIVAWNREIAQGQHIGSFSKVVPRGGSLTGPHLHFEVQPRLGLVNQPPGLDPVPVLIPGYYTGGGGTIAPDMTPDQDALLKRNNAILEAIYKGTGATALPVIAKQLDAIKASIAAIPQSSTSVDLTALNAKLDAIQAVVDKIDRGE